MGNNVYIIEAGECDVLKEKDGFQTHVATLERGEYFGEMAVLSDASRNATVRARTAMDVLLLSKNDFDLLKTSIPAFGQVFRELATSRTAMTMKNSA